MQRWSMPSATFVAGEVADRIEHLWRKVWWGLHYEGRGGAAVLAQSALDIALHDLKAKRAKLPLWKPIRHCRPASDIPVN
jgi:L-alanine-DL-glutamate epimerase-like enolase superfamily enzyme